MSAGATGAARKAAAAAALASVQPFKFYVRRAAVNKTNNRQLAAIASWKIVRGDIVFVNSGRSKGQTGRVLEVLRRRNRLVVEGLNLVKRHVRAEGAAPGGSLSFASPIHYSNLALVDPTLNRPTKVAIRFTEAGDKVRVSKKSGAVIPWPSAGLKFDRPLRPAEPGAKDTPAEVAQLVTFEPPPELRAYLTAASAPASSVFAPVTDAARRVPKVLREVRLRRKNRNEIRAAWETGVARSRLAAEVSAEVRRVLARAAEAAAAAASAAASAVGGTASVVAGRATASGGARAAEPLR